MSQTANAADGSMALNSQVSSAASLEKGELPLYKVDFVSDNGDNSLRISLTGSTAIKRSSGEVDLVREGTGELLERLPTYIDSGTELGQFKADYMISDNGRVVSILLPDALTNTVESSTIQKSGRAQARGKYDQVCVKNGVLWSMGIGAAFGIGGAIPGVLVGSIVGALQGGITAIATCKK